MEATLIRRATFLQPIAILVGQALASTARCILNLTLKTALPLKQGLQLTGVNDAALLFCILA